jgi:hypothetical protein
LERSKRGQRRNGAGDGIRLELEGFERGEAGDGGGERAGDREPGEVDVDYTVGGVATDTSPAARVGVWLPGSRMVSERFDEVPHCT